MMTIQACYIGQKVFFGRPNGEKTLGEIVKIGRSKVKVRTLESRGHRVTSGEVWGVPVTLLTPAEVGRPAQVTRVAQPVAGPDYSGMTTAELLSKIRGIYNGLSPENLWADGERTATQARAAASFLNRELRACFKALGREVSEDEAYGLTG